MEEQETNIQEIVQQETNTLTRQDIEIITGLGTIALALLFAIFVTKGR
jgi:hypothetical protein